MSADEKEPDLFDDDKIEVVEAEAAAPQAEAKADSDELSPEDGIKQLKERLETEKRAREDAERRAYEAQQQVQKAQRDVQDGDYQLIVSAIDTTKRNAEILKNSYAEAMGVGDYRKAADIHEAISLNSSKLTTLENGKNALEQKLKQPVQPIQPLANDPVEALASQLTPRSAAWVRSHPEVVKDPRSYQRMVGAHNMAMADGHVPDSDSYFEAVESHLGIRRAVQEPEDEGEIVSVAAQPVQKRSAAPPPTPSSKVSSSNSGKPNTVRLTAEQREMASMMGMKPEDYAKNMVALKREGKLN